MKGYLQLVLQTIGLFLAGSVAAQSWQTLYNRSDSLLNAGKYAEAIVVANQALHLAEVMYTKEHPTYARSLWKLGSIQLDKGAYVDAKTSLSASQDLYKKLNATSDTTYCDVLLGLGILNRIQGNYPTAESILLDALRLTARLRGKEHVSYINTLGSLGNVYAASQNFRKAEAVLLEVLSLRAKQVGMQRNDYANTLNSLGLVYLNLEDYARSEAYFEEALQIWEEMLGADHPNVGALLGNMGFLYLNQGAYEAAIQRLIKAVAIQKKKAPGSLNHIVVLINTALSYTRTKQYEKADSLYRAVLPMVAEKLGVDHPQYATLLNNVGFVAEARGQYAVAIEQYQKAYQLYSRKSGAETMGSAEMMSNIASAYYSMNQLSRADSLYQKTLALMKNQIGSNSLRYAGTLDSYGRLLASMNRIDSSVAVVATVQAIIYQNLTKNFIYQTARQKDGLINKWSSVAAGAFDIAQKYPQRSDVGGLAYSSSLFLKNLLLSQYISLFAGGGKTPDTKRQWLTDTLRLVKNTLAAQYALPISQRKNLDSLEARAETIEKALTRQLIPFRQAKQALAVQWENVRKALKPTEAAIEFISFPYVNGRRQTDTVCYMALVLRPGDKAPHVVPLLADEMPLRRLLIRKGMSGGAALYATRGSELDTDQLTQGDSLYQLIWKPIDKLLAGVKTVYLAPSGLLHLVAFAALPYRVNKAPKGIQYLVDRYQLRQMGSTRQVVIPTVEGDGFENLASANLYGGIQYDKSDTPPRRTWPFLPGTQREVEQIGQLIGPKAIRITGTLATEESVKALSGQSPMVLHLATHGFVFADPAITSRDSTLDSGGKTFQQMANPLFRTGLLMAGANRAWQGERPVLGADDGILTAYEVANLNLSGTKLVVLSACETALGDIRGSEGVFGLQRAFKMAGAGYLLTSLWPVSDEATSQLMTQFYRNWKLHTTIRAAFQQTQLYMRKKYPPAVWAAFVLIE